MDTLTHIAFGACLGEVIAGKQLGKKAMLLGAVLSNLPDIDVTTALWMDSTSALLAHRGITHSIFFAFIATPLISLAFKRLFTKSEFSFNQWLLLVGSGIFIHIFMDAFTSFGTGWFEPFNHARISFNTLFIFDPLFSLPLIISFSALLILKRSSLKRNVWMKIGLYSSAIYFISAGINKIYVNHVIEKDLAERSIAYDKYFATPTPFNNLLWYIVVSSGPFYHIGYYSILDKSPLIEYQELNKNDSLLAAVRDFKEIQNLIQFSNGYYCATKRGDSIIFNVMRFGQEGGWYKKNAPFVFNFDIQNLNANAMVLQKGRLKSFNGAALPKLWERMRGKI